ncbi:hypothetical protein ACHWQZ_G007746 [Mnemiopsis leidyi]
MLLLLLPLALQGTLSQELVRETITCRERSFVPLRCGVKSENTTWLRTVDGEQKDVRSLGDRRFVITREGDMYISRVKQEHAGVYTCQNGGVAIKEVTVEIAPRPTITIAPSDVTVHTGELVHLSCEGDGDPKPTMEWQIYMGVLTRDVTVIPDNLTEKEILDYKGGNFLTTEAGHLYIRDPVAAYSATYICVATNVGGRSWATAQVLILEPPRITTTPKDTNSVDGESVVMTCYATGNPLPMITWRLEGFDGNTIEELGKHPSGRYELDHNKALRIRSPLPSDSGNYTCVATNIDGVAEASAIVKVLFRETKTGKEGGFVSLKCGSSAPATWFKTVNGDKRDVKSLSDNRYIITSDGSFFISRLRETDKGIYSCHKAGVAVKEVTVEISHRPTIALAPSDVTVHSGELIHLQCEGSGSPKPTMEWKIHVGFLRNVTVIPDNLTEEEVLNFKGGNFLVTEAGHLYIRDTVAGYSATYICIASNVGGTNLATARVLILEPPRITIRPKDTKSVDGESISFTCQASGNPLPVITWRLEGFDGNTIEKLEKHPSGRYELDAHKALTIRSPLPSDSGNYTCVATNIDGVAEASAIVKVLFRETKTGNEGGFVSLKCGSPATWFKTVNGEKRDVKSLSDNRYIITRDGSFFISRLRETDKGIYSCHKAGVAIKEVTVDIAPRPTIALAPADVTARLGELIHLPCEGSGNPKPTMEWRVGKSFLKLKKVPVIPDNLTEKEILNYKGGRFLVTEAGHLYIRNPTATFSTEYVCIASSVGGRSWASARVFILEPPRLTKRPKDTTFYDDGNSDEVGLTCRATGNPSPIISWRVETFEGVTIEELENHPSGKYELDPYKILKIRFPLPSDSGNYTCVATNIDGVAEASAILNVQPRGN